MEVTPITAQDIRGISLEPQDMAVDELAKFVNYIKTVNTTLGTPNDTPDGYANYLSFRNEIQNASIPTFDVDEVLGKSASENVLSNLDLTGENEPPFVLPATYFLNFGGSLIFNNTIGFSPFQTTPTPKAKARDGYSEWSDCAVNPFMIHGAPVSAFEYNRS